MAEINITTVRDMIDSSFYEEDTNTVNFKMIQNVLYILARQLRILQRHVSLERARRLYMLQGEIKVTEIKVHSKVPKDSSPEGRDGKKGGGSPENKGTKGGPGDQGEKRGLGEKGSKGGQGSKGGPGEKGSKGGQGAQGISGRKEDKGSPDTTGSKGSPKGRQGTPQDQGLQENQGAKGGQGTADSKKKPGGQTKGDEAGEEGGVKQSSDKSATKSSKGKTTDPSAADDATTLKAATGKSQGKSGDRKGGKKGDDDDMDVLQEKLLVVSRTSSTDGGRGTVATLDQFRNMVSQIRELQAKFGLEDTLDTEALRGALHKETSLSHPIAAVNMSSRLEAAERKLAAIMPIVTDLAEKTPGIDMDAAYDDIFLRPLKTSSSRTGAAGSDEDDQEAATAEGPITGPKQESDEESLEMDAPDAKFALLDPSIKGVTHIEMNEGLEEIYDVVMKIITGASKTQYNAADGAMKRTQKVDARLDQAMKVGDAFTKLDTSVDEYTEKITDLDGRLTTQMTSYQDELMQMQHNLESGLDTMAEVLAAPTEDAAAIAELNGYFTNFQFDIERTLERQQELRTLQMEYSANLDVTNHDK
ncbi:hypothetical protein MSG28_007583 [Choristoneura fumiferana]|uniref:Uncharacterized protein n=1 Tax=Choristoneura fumiferana TaxID=7141 RepID=A0ACC0JY34_CHOFU|nr:hypothetical protein MSG28_007583 [Choristoneura fumiferana]